MFVASYRILLKKLGASNWWPGETPFEVMIGAILTQNTSWSNVERAILVLKENQLLEPERMFRVSKEKLAPMIRSSGYFNQKAYKLCELTRWFEKYQFSVDRLKEEFAGKPEFLRRELLSLHGIGPETADSILCYAVEFPFFVVDAYTFRWLERYNPEKYISKYEDLRTAVEKDFRSKFDEETLTDHLNEFHALIVRLGKDYCKKRNPECSICPLVGRCRQSGVDNQR